MDCGEQLGDSDLATGQNGFKLGSSGITITLDVIIVMMTIGIGIN